MLEELSDIRELLEQMRDGSGSQSLLRVKVGIPHRKAQGLCRINQDLKTVSMAVCLKSPWPSPHSIFPPLERKAAKSPGIGLFTTQVLRP